MSTTTKSPRMVALEALTVGESSFAKYSSRYSCHKYTQPQLFACLVLKTFMGLDYRSMEKFLRDSKDICFSLKLLQIPHFTTLQKACERLLKQNLVPDLLQITVERHFDSQKKLSA